MAVNTLRFAQVTGAPQDTGRAPSDALWAGCPIGTLMQDRTQGIYFFDDFQDSGKLTTNNTGQFGRWATYADTNAVATTDPGQEGGVLELGAGSNSGVGIIFTMIDGWLRLVSGATGFPLQGESWFEIRLAVGSIAASKRDIFVGLADHSSSTLAATGVFASADTFSTTPGLIGFNSRGGASAPNADFRLVYNVAGGTVQTPTNLQTLVNTVTGANMTAYAAVTNGPATGFVKLGFHFNPNAYPMLIASASTGQTASTLARPLVRVFVNGQPVTAFLTSTNVQAATFPTGFMAPIIAYTSTSGTAPGDLYVDWVACAMRATF